MNVIASLGVGISGGAWQSVIMKVVLNFRQIATSAHTYAARFPRNDGKLKTQLFRIPARPVRRVKSES